MNMKRFVKYVGMAACLFLMGFSAQGQIYATESGTAEFDATATLNKYTGRSDKLEGMADLGSGKLRFRLPIESLDTGNGKRNKDMQELLKTDKYPYAMFSGQIISTYDPEATKPQRVLVSGIFELHGVQKPLQVEGVLDINRNSLHIMTGWDLNITDYGIDPPRFAFNKVDDKHRIKVDAELAFESGQVHKADDTL